MKILFYSILTIILLLSGCATPEYVTKVPKTSLDGEWKSIISNATVRFDKGTISGNDGCNQFIGSYATEENSLSISDKMMSTMMACSNKNATAFKNALMNTKFYENDGKTLLLMGGKGEPLIEFKMLSNTLEEGFYEIKHINNSKQAVLTLKSPISLKIGPDGKMEGDTGCNQYTTSYTLKGEQITIGFPAITRKICPPELMEQEQQFITTLSRASTFKRNGEKWEIRDESGTLLMDMIKD
ncbi:MAG: META domain-containing protein [Sulfuricurvum sp.]|nr:META domain-containing protein [Sulfuricurvum sp.]MDD5386083.1 META domain-containing protein [Sulfuricurvum sp.]